MPTVPHHHLFHHRLHKHLDCTVGVAQTAEQISECFLLELYELLIKLRFLNTWGI